MKKKLFLFGIVIMCFAFCGCEEVSLPGENNPTGSASNTPMPTVVIVDIPITAPTVVTPIPTAPAVTQPVATPTSPAVVAPTVAVPADVEKLGLPRNGIVNTSSTSLNVRQSCSTSSAVVSKFSKGSDITVISATYSEGRYWYEVYYRAGGDLKKGYVAAEYVKLDSSSKGGNGTVYPTPTAAIIQDTGSRGLSFALAEDGTSYVVSGIGTCTDKEIVIPNIYQGLKVSSIGDYAFRGCTSVERISFSNTITRIGIEAFESCPNLIAVYYTGSIDEWCGIIVDTNVHSSNYIMFVGGNLLEGEITIGSSVKKINPGTFSNCEFIKKVNIPSGVSVMSGAFSGCSALTDVTIGSEASIEINAFAYCSGLRKAVIGNNCRKIGSGAFVGASSTFEIYLPQSIESIRNGFIDNYSKIHYAGTAVDWMKFGLAVDTSRMVFSSTAK